MPPEVTCGGPNSGPTKEAPHPGFRAESRGRRSVQRRCHRRMPPKRRRRKGLSPESPRTVQVRSLPVQGKPRPAVLHQEASQCVQQTRCANNLGETPIARRAGSKAHGTSCSGESPPHVSGGERLPRRGNKRASLAGWASCAHLPGAKHGGMKQDAKGLGRGSSRTGNPSRARRRFFSTARSNPFPPGRTV